MHTQEESQQTENNKAKSASKKNYTEFLLYWPNTPGMSPAP